MKAAGLLPPLLLGLVLFAGGCWDRVDIERRALVTAVAVDRPAGGRAPDRTEPEAGGAVRERRFRVTYEIPIARAVTGGAEGGGGAARGPKTWVVTTDATTLFEAGRQLATRTYRQPYYGYLEAVLIGEETARGGLWPMTDFFQRSFEANWKASVYVVPGEAARALRTNQPMEDVLGLYLTRISTRTRTLTARHADVDFVDVMKAMAGTRTLLIPRLTPGATDVRVGGSAVIRDGRLAGWMGDADTRSVLMVRGEARGGEVVVASPWPPGLPITVDLLGVDSRRRARLEGGRPVFDVDLRLRGAVGEKGGTKDIYEPEAVKEIEGALAGTVKAQVEAAVRRAQRDFQADVFAFHRPFEVRFPAEWRRLKGDWNRAFAGARVNVSVTARIRNVGASH